MVSLLQRNPAFPDSDRNPSEMHKIIHDTRFDEKEEEQHLKKLNELLKSKESDDILYSVMLITPRTSGDSSPTSQSGHSTSPTTNSTPNTSGHLSGFTEIDSNGHFVYPENSNGGLSPKLQHGKISVSSTPPGHIYSRAESQFPYLSPSSPCEYKSLTSSIPHYPCFTTPRSHNIITVYLPFGQHTKVRQRNMLKETILKRLSRRNIPVEDCRFYQILLGPGYQPRRIEIDLDSIDKKFIGNELVIEHKNPRNISNSPHKFTKVKIHMKLCFVCKKSLFKDFFMCEKCKSGFHEKCLQRDLVCTAGALKNEPPVENTIRNGVNHSDRKCSSSLGHRSRSNSEPKDPQEVLSPPPVSPNCNGNEEPVMTKYLVPIGEKIEFAPKIPHKVAVNNTSSFPNNPNNNNNNRRRISASSYINRSPRPQCKISLQHPLHDYSRNISADSVKQKRSLGGLSDHENLRSKSISNLDTVIAGSSPDPVLSEMRIGSAPTSPKSNTPTPTSPPLMSSVPLNHHRKDPVFSHEEPSNTMLLRNSHKPSNTTRFSTWVVQRGMVKFGELIGQGSYGTVYKGEYHGTVAIKMLTCSNPGPEQLKAFNEEIEMLRQTRHDNILLFMGYIPYPFAILTSWCDGNTLYFHLHVSEEELQQDKINQIVLQTSQGMSYLHTSRKIIHRDLKSQNIFLLSDYTVKIGDFGLATMKTRWSGPKQLIQPQGSVLWMAPEVMRAGTKGYEDPYSFRSDVYSFGIVLYEIVTGELPFKDQDMHILLFQIGMGILKPEITSVRKCTPEYLTELCNKCISFKKDDRPVFSDFCDKLEIELFSADSESENESWLPLNVARKITRRVSESNIEDISESWPNIFEQGVCREIQTLPYQTPN